MLMKSPASPTTHLVKTELAENLTAYACPDSGGTYLPAESYWRWLSKHPERLPKLPLSEDQLPPSDDSQSLRLCPESGNAMLRYKVGHGFPFYIDRSPTGGIWFDEGEWEALKKHNFHDELHLIFTLPWQKRVRDAEKEEKLNHLLRERIGEEAFEKVISFRNWLASQPEKSAILALLKESELNKSPF
jgi:hypothetical protein